MKKRNLLSVILVMAVLISCLSWPVSASAATNADNATSGMMEATDEEMQYWHSIKKGDESEVNRTRDDALAAVSENGRAASWVLTSRNFYYYAQEKNYSCGAACVKMALRNITGTTYSEATVRTGCQTSSSTGTSLANMATYINEMQSYNTYVVRYQQDKDTMQSNLADCITVYDSPPMIGVKETTASGWNYDLGAHCIIIYAVRSDESAFMISDPWAGYIGDSANRDLSVSVDMLYTGYNAINAGYMY